MSDVKDFNTQMIDEFRANHGQLGGPFAGGTMLLLHHKGARAALSASTRSPISPSTSGYAIFASKAGAPTNPDWYYNLKANPDTTVEIGDDTVSVHARVAEGDERDKIWTKQVERCPASAGTRRSPAARSPSSSSSPADRLPTVCSRATSHGGLPRERTVRKRRR